MSLALISDIETISDWIIDAAVLSGSLSLYKRPGCANAVCTTRHYGLLYVSTPWDLANQGHLTHMHCQETYMKWTYSCGPIFGYASSSTLRGHDNVHDDMNMYVIMHDQCLFIAMINSFHT